MLNSIQLLLNCLGFDINKEDGDLLFHASRIGYTELVQWLLKKEDINVNKADSFGKTALYMASYNGQTEIIKLFLERPEIKVNKDYGGKTSFNLALEKGYTEIAVMLLEHPGTNLTKGISKDEDIMVKIPNIIFTHDAASEICIQEFFVSAILGNSTQIAIFLQKSAKYQS